jgi:hypothetical protein
MPATHFLVNFLTRPQIDNTLENFTCNTEKYIEILKSNKYYLAYLKCANYLYKLGRRK